MRLGSALIPLLSDGWYYGQDINAGTIAFGEEVLREAGIPEQAPYTLCIRPVRSHPSRSPGADCLCQFVVQSPHTEFDFYGPAAVADRACSVRCALRHVLLA